jgi:hypothetical protein
MTDKERFKILVDLHLSNPKALKVEISGVLFRFLLKRALGLYTNLGVRTIEHLEEEKEYVATDISSTKSSI